MRFNSRELTCLACQPSDLFDKEGVLFVKERQDGLFRKGEAYVERLFRLRGNLLFYFKTRESSSEVLGVIVLERSLVQLDDDDQLLFSFVIVFEGEERGLRLATRTEQERDSWIERLHIAGYECLRIQLESLREQLKARTGRDPIESGGLAVDDTAAEAISVDTADYEPTYEMCLACLGLPVESSGHAPDTFAIIHYQAACDQQWITHSHTEIVERCVSPMYLSTISLSSHISMATQIRVTVYSVKERLTNTMAHIGYALFTLSNVLTAVNNSIVLRLNSLDSHDVGSLSVTASESKKPVHGASADIEMSSSDRICRTLSLASEYRRLGMETMQADYAKIITKTFRFPVSDNGDQTLIVNEYLGESRLTYTLPVQLLKLFADEERCKIEQLERLGSLTEEYEQHRQQVTDFHVSAFTRYLQHANFLTGFQGTFFKPSTKKGHKEVEFAPTNLHLQRMLVYNSVLQTSACYDITTVGVFTACAQKFKRGGLRRLMQQLEQQNSHAASNIALSNTSSFSTVLNQATTVNDLMSKLTVLHKATDAVCDSICEAAVLGDASNVTGVTAHLTDKTRQLIELCESELINKGVSDHSSVRSLGITTQQPTKIAASNSHSSADVQGSWFGADFVSGPAEEPWDLTKLNTQAALMCVMSKVDELTGQQGDHCTQWLDQISPLIIKLKRCIELMCSRASAGLTLIALQDCMANTPLLNTISYRRDVVFSQAITATTSAFITKLSSSVTNEFAIKQFIQLGMLIQFESLITCYSDEMGMLEDMEVAMNDLVNVTFRVQKLPIGTHTEVILSGQRYSYSVIVQLCEDVFNALPLEAQEQHVFRIVPVMFSIGINEQASLAEKFGDISFQEAINRKNYDHLHGYYKNYVNFQQKHSKVDNQRTVQSLADLMHHLSACMLSKKSKNVDILHMAEEVCLAMNGARMTGCKSAKDRTAMAVTLEQVRLLQREHDMASDVFLHALECFRSEGVRRENTRKNTGTAKYAFNSLQLLSLPKLYRPPAGTYANVET